MIDDQLDENLVSEVLRDFGYSVIALGWSVEDADAAVSYLHRCYHRGLALGDAMVEVWKLRDQGKLRVKEAEDA